jgi:hypothetical protein
MKLQAGEVCGALEHPDVISTLAQKIFESKIIERLPGRIVLLMEDGTQRAVVDLQWVDQPKTWLVTAYIPIK